MPEEAPAPARWQSTSLAIFGEGPVPSLNRTFTSPLLLLSPPPRHSSPQELSLLARPRVRAAMWRERGEGEWHAHSWHLPVLASATRDLNVKQAALVEPQTLDSFAPSASSVLLRVVAVGEGRLGQVQRSLSLRVGLRHSNVIR